MPIEGERVGRFEVVREIGRGGMAVVYLARQMDLDRDVALKQLGAFHATDPAAAARFLQESRITGSLGHPNIVTVHEYLQHERVPYIAMEYLERGSLRPHVRQLSLAQIAGVLEGVLAALAHAAERGIVHRDLKPENLMITTMGTVKVADFGIAKAVNEVQTSFATATGTTVGTPAYMAPEQAMARGVGPSTDLYAVGVMAYEMLVGKVPYTADTPIAVLLQHVNEPLPPPIEAKPDLDPELAAWLESMLAKTPEGRPKDAAAAWDGLEGIVIGILGPRWRRDARLLDRGSAAVAQPLTPAPFESIRTPATPPPENRPVEPAPAPTPDPAPAAPSAPPVAPAPMGFETFGRPGDPAPAAPPRPAPRPAAPPPAPAPTGFQTFARPGAAGAGSRAAAEAPPAAAEPAAEAPLAADGFQTFDPQPRAASAPPPATPAPPPPPPPPVATPPAPEPEPPPAGQDPQGTVTGAESLELTAPPRSRTPVPTEAPPAAPEGPPRGPRRGPLLIGAAVVVAAIAAIAVVTAGGGGGGGGEAPAAPTQDTTPVIPDIVLEDRPDIAAGGGSLLIADAAGRIVRIAGGRTAASLADPAAPRAVAVAGGRVFTADGGAVTTLRARDLRPLASFAFPAGVALATAGGEVAAAGAPLADRGRVCLVGATALGPCVTLDFAPSGLGFGDGSIAVADAEAGKVLLLRVTGDALVPGTPIAVGASPHGRMVEDRGRVYVSVQRGVAAIDLATGGAVGTFATPTTPADLAVVSATGVLAAALPGSGAVALIDTTLPGAQPRLVDVGAPPAAVVVVDGEVRALTTEGDLVAIDPVAGTAGEGAAVAGFGEEPAPSAALTKVTSSVSGRRVTVTLALGKGDLPASALRVADGGIADGRASLELWQGGISSAVKALTVAGVRVSAAERAGRLLVSLAADAQRFTSLKANVTRGGAAVSVVMVEKPAPPATPTTPSTPVPGGPSSPTPTPTPTPDPTPTPTPKPKPPVIETG